MAVLTPSKKAEEYDKGPVLAQRKVPVYDTDNAEELAKRVFKQEHQLLPEVIAKPANKHSKT